MGGLSGTRLRDNRRAVVAGRAMETCQGWRSWGPRETAARILRGAEKGKRIEKRGQSGEERKRERCGGGGEDKDMKRRNEG